MKAEFQAGGTGRLLSKTTPALVRGLSGSLSRMGWPMSATEMVEKTSGFGNPSQSTSSLSPFT